MTAATSSHVHAKSATGDLTVALAGNPNVGKTTLFNALTGLKQKVANYPGVTVEKKVGRTELVDSTGRKTACEIIDLPGTYSLASRSPDEHVARQVVLGQIEGTPRPDVIVVVADASNLERNLYLVTQVLELGRPAVVALSMMDIAEKQGRQVDVSALAKRLGVPVVPVQAHKGVGIETLKKAIAEAGGAKTKALDLPLPDVMQTHVNQLQTILIEEKLAAADQAAFDAHLMLSMGDDDDVPDPRRHHPRVREALRVAIADCEKADIDPIGAEIEAHYSYIGGVVGDCVSESATGPKASGTDRLDRILTHKVWGLAIFVGIMGLVFWSIFSWAAPLMKFLSDTVIGDWIGGTIGDHMAEGPLKSLLVDGVIAGVGNVVVFLPQIALLFLFLSILEDSGYMSRAAFLMDRIMSKVGLHGKSFIPLLSGYACAIPAIMGTRVIENRRDRLATILILPLMSCSARLPVYALIIATFFGTYEGWQQAGILLAMYALGTLTAFGMAWVFKRTLLKGPTPPFILEMPPYRLPHWKTVITTVNHRCWHFLKRAGTLIFAFSVLMWAATHYPKPAGVDAKYEAILQAPEARLAELKQVASTPPETLTAAKDAVEEVDNAKSQEILENSAAGRVGRAIAPVFKPLGYDWKLSIGVTGAFFAREVVVSTLGIVYSVGEADEASKALQKKIREAYTPLVGLSLMVFVVFCMQCLSTLAVAKRETGHWGWPVFMFVYMTGLAYVAAMIVYQGGTALGFGK